MNRTGKSEDNCAETVQTIVIGSNGMMWGPFKDGAEASAWAKRKWPGQEQYDPEADYPSGPVHPCGWDLTALWPPD